MKKLLIFSAAALLVSAAMASTASALPWGWDRPADAPLTGEAFRTPQHRLPQWADPCFYGPYYGGYGYGGAYYRTYYRPYYYGSWPDSRAARW